MIVKEKNFQLSRSGHDQPGPLKPKLLRWASKYGLAHKRKVVKRLGDPVTKIKRERDCNKKKVDFLQSPKGALRVARSFTP